MKAPKKPGPPLKATREEAALTPGMQKYVKMRARGMLPVAAAQASGATNPKQDAARWNKTPQVIAALEKEFVRAEKQADMSKKKVMDGLMEAIDQAKLVTDPSAQIAGWREIAKICGYYEPQKVQVDVSVSAKRLFSKFETMSDEELLQLAEQEIVDADFEVVEDESAAGTGQLLLRDSEKP